MCVSFSQTLHRADAKGHGVDYFGRKDKLFCDDSGFGWNEVDAVESGGQMYLGGVYGCFQTGSTAALKACGWLAINQDVAYGLGDIIASLAVCAADVVHSIVGGMQVNWAIFFWQERTAFFNNDRICGFLAQLCRKRLKYFECS